MCVLLLLSLVLMFSCGKESKSPTGTPLEDTYTISGTVNGADSVIVTLSGDTSGSWMVKKSGGVYLFTVADGGTYTVTPSKSGYVFTPDSKSFTNVTANQSQNFTAIEEKNSRQEIQQMIDVLGEPDEIIKGGYGIDQYEMYFYDRKDLNRAYVFQKSDQGMWYVKTVIYPADLYYDRETYEPPKIVHSPVKTAPPGKVISIKANVTDDQYVKDVILYCRALGETDFLHITMAPGDSSLYIGEIPAERVTIAGVEYHIEARDSGHTSRLPQVKGEFLIAVDPSFVITYGKQQIYRQLSRP